jgi:hypothetical protein
LEEVVLEEVVLEEVVLEEVVLEVEVQSSLVLCVNCLLSLLRL